MEGDDEKDRLVLDAVSNDEDGWLTSYDKLATQAGVSKTSIGNYMDDKGKLGRCLAKQGGVYELTNIGETALHTDWDEITEVL